MQKFSTVKNCSLVFCILLVFAEMTSSVPFYSDDENDLTGSNREKDYQIRNRSIALGYVRRYENLTPLLTPRGDLPPPRRGVSLQRRIFFVKNLIKNIRDLYELLFKKKALEDQLSQTHQIARKSNRSPSLRLRFGKKRDPYYANPPLMGHPVHLLEDLDNL